MKEINMPPGLSNLLQIDIGQLLLETVDSYISVLEWVLSSIPDEMTVGQVKEVILRETKKELIRRETEDAE